MKRTILFFDFVSLDTRLLKLFIFVSFRFVSQNEFQIKVQNTKNKCKYYCLLFIYFECLTHCCFWIHNFIDFINLSSAIDFAGNISRKQKWIAYTCVMLHVITIFRYNISKISTDARSIERMNSYSWIHLLQLIR